MYSWIVKQLIRSEITGMNPFEGQSECGLAAHSSFCALSTKCVVFMQHVLSHVILEIYTPLLAFFRVSMLAQ